MLKTEGNFLKDKSRYDSLKKTHKDMNISSTRAGLKHMQGPFSEE